MRRSADQYRKVDACQMCDAGRVVDGDISTCMRTEDIGITSNFDKKTWWYVDLGKVSNVYNIRILFKDYNGESKYVVIFTFVSLLARKLKRK